MALMTSSSGTSSTEPRKLVSRRSMRMARSLSALPRNAVISCRRSVSFKGRKSIDVLLSRVPEKHHRSRLRCQFRKQEVNALVHSVLVGISRQELLSAAHVIANLVLLQQDAN